METFFKNREFRWITISDWVSAFGDAIFLWRIWHLRLL